MEIRLPRLASASATGWAGTEARPRRPASVVVGRRQPGSGPGGVVDQDPLGIGMDCEAQWSGREGWSCADQAVGVELEEQAVEVERVTAALR